ncbi:malic enzyme, NAD binding domain-containing protein [Sarocladium implicatum]|nr:malic enzyme, NAD binding domain-containing protein [Sarocladium implicatum]
MTSDNPLDTTKPLPCALTGASLLNHPFFNKGSAFPPDERRTFGLTGLLPERVQTLEQQAERAHKQYLSRDGSLARNTFLTSLKEQNEVLFYKVLSDHLKDMFSVVYTPTEGDAIQNYSRLFRRPEGCFLNIGDVDRVHSDLAQWGRPEDIDYIVVTDGEEILGIGDQGVGGILISIAKLLLTTVCAGIHPNRVLPVVLDCGTDNEELLKDDLYLGLQRKRVRGKEYDQFVDRFVKSATELYPKAYIHFEDFGLTNARRILDLYRPHIPCFNDDVQGTGCVTLAAITAGLKVSGQTLGDAKIVIFGAGSAGVGIADQIRDAICAEVGLGPEEAAGRIWLIDRPGLLLKNTPNTSDAQKPFLKDPSHFSDESTDLLSVVSSVHPNILIGTSTVPGAFTKEIVQAMYAHAPRPIILPLSNPTRLHEAKPHDLLHWTDGQALVATGSPFDPVKGPWGAGGREVEITVAECNNSVVFPGIGLGCVLSRASQLTDAMLVAAVGAVAAESPAMKDPRGALLPDVDVVRDVSVRVAREVVKKAVEEGVARVDGIPQWDEELETWIRKQMWEPKYRKFEKVEVGEATRLAKGEMGRAGTVDRG